MRGRFIQVLYTDILSLKPGENPLFVYRNKTIKVRKTRSKKLTRLKDVEKELTNRVFEKFQIDTKYWVINRKTFYAIGAIDVITRMVFTYAYTRHTARWEFGMLKAKE